MRSTESWFWYPQEYAVRSVHVICCLILNLLGNMHHAWIIQVADLVSTCRWSTLSRIASTLVLLLESLCRLFGSQMEHCRSQWVKILDPGFNLIQSMLYPFPILGLGYGKDRGWIQNGKQDFSWMLTYPNARPQMPWHHRQDGNSCPGIRLGMIWSNIPSLQ